MFSSHLSSLIFSKKIKVTLFTVTDRKIWSVHSLSYRKPHCFSTINSSICTIALSFIPVPYNFPLAISRVSPVYVTHSLYFPCPCTGKQCILWSPQIPCPPSCTDFINQSPVPLFSSIFLPGLSPLPLHKTFIIPSSFTFINDLKYYFHFSQTSLSSISIVSTACTDSFRFFIILLTVYASSQHIFLFTLPISENHSSYLSSGSLFISLNFIFTSLSFPP